jgi:HrpA-like RNA helicase
MTESITTAVDNFASDLMEDEEDAACVVDEVVLKDGLDRLHIDKEPSSLDMTQRSQWHHDAQRLKLKKPRFREMQAARALLPAYAHREEICAAVRNHRIILIRCVYK